MQACRRPPEFPRQGAARATRRAARGPEATGSPRGQSKTRLHRRSTWDRAGFPNGNISLEAIHEVLQHPDGLGAMEGLQCGHKSMSLRQERNRDDETTRSARQGYSAFNSSTMLSHNAICHRLINFIHQPGYLCVSLDASHNALELRPQRPLHRSGRRSVCQIIWFGELNFYIHAWSKILLGSRNAALAPSPWPDPSVANEAYPPDTGGIKAASSPGRKSSPAARYSQFFATRTEPRSEANDG